MTRRAEISYMQARICRMATEKWGITIDQVGFVFEQHGVLEHIRDCYELYHVEGDEAVWQDLQPFFRSRGCSYATA